MQNVLIIGCGLTGAVIARELAERGHRILILERRNHIGGNMYDYINKGDYLGEVTDGKLILLFQKKGKILDYNNYV